MKKPPTFINRPLTRVENRKRFMRKVTSEDLNWKRTDFLIRFMSPTGKLMNRWQTRMHNKVQRKLA